MTKRARRLREHPTQAEMNLWRLLRRRQLGNLGFRRQHPIGPYVLDFYCPSLRTAVEVDGGQHARAAEAQRDESRTRWLQARGVLVIRFWNNEVLGNVEDVWSVLAEALEARRELLASGRAGASGVPADLKREGRATPFPTVPLSGGGGASSTLDVKRLGRGKTGVGW